MGDIVIRRETKADYRQTENLVRESFWNVYRPGCGEHYVLHVLRDDPAFDAGFPPKEKLKLPGQLFD